MKVAAHHANVILSSKLLKLLARSPPIDGKFMNFAHGLAFQIDQMRTRLTFWLEHDRIAVFWINSSIPPDGSRVSYGNVQINTAATASLTDHLDSISPSIFVPANHAIASTFLILCSASAANAATTAPKRNVDSAPLLCHSTPATAPEITDAIPTEP